jgi:bis(5'-nucleosyl)-tetraphosphatase (symmetrical)
MGHHSLMPTYAIGDIQGCWDTLQRLLGRIAFDPSTDRLWLVGDLVNRGPQSLEVLRWAQAQGDAVTAVLGNHDLHLLAAAEGLRPKGPHDTLDALLAAPDRDALLDWLAHRPLMHRDENTVLVHAGLLPHWDVETAEHHARQVEAQLRGSDGRALLAAFSAPCPDELPPEEDLPQRGAFVLHAMTRLRICRADGRMNLDYTGTLAEIPVGHHAWFQAPNRRWADHTLVTGHWAALDLHLADGILGLDTGCGWGRSLTALRLTDRAVFQEPCVDVLPHHR